MTTITVTYTCKYRIKFAPHYVYTTCGKCYNQRSSKLIKQVYKSGCIGYIIDSKFYSLTKLRNFLEKIPKREYCPFSNGTIEI